MRIGNLNCLRDCHYCSSSTTEREGGERDGSRREERNQKRYGEGRERKKKELEEIERKGNTMSAGIHSLQLQRKPVIFMIDTAS